MKKQFLIVALLILAGFGQAEAQVNVHINIGQQPVWGPVGYERAQYYYMPDIESYYDIETGSYVYYEGDRWVTRKSLPPRYANYDLYHGYKVVINEPSPWVHHDRYRREYVQYRGRHDQPVIRDSREYKYYQNPGHPNHKEWHGNEGNPGRGHDDRGRDDHHDNGNGHGEKHDNGNGRGEGHGNGNGHGEGHGNGHGEKH